MSKEKADDVAPAPSSCDIIHVGEYSTKVVHKVSTPASQSSDSFSVWAVSTEELEDLDPCFKNWITGNSVNENDIVTT
eukprot:CFRG0555T1